MKKPAMKYEKKTSAVMTALCIMMTLVMVVLLASCGSKKKEEKAYVPEHQKETTIISEYYELDDEGRILPTACDRHDIDIIEGGGADAPELLGVWDMDENTYYVFDGKDRGILLTGVDNYTFVYSAENGELRVDSDVSQGEDVVYEYTIDGDSMTWKRGSATYHLTRKSQ